ncbi:penicillin acylase family protein [Natronomonas salina]|uniref:penicillin acylase family protein n=1 Tax=Natronomonas salina TaxID=1710540 RepID=UPI0015B5A562|nr:penicillin acylase family protein [Natronomonas salina]QLD89779.1 penicillin acylase family protein [Natronomonas salina]
MDRYTTRRGLLGAIVGAGVGGAALSPAGDLLDSFAPPSGRAWRTTRGEVPEEVSSPHGDATVTYDDYHVPHVEADDELAAYYAVGYAQAADRLFEMDLIRRLMDGRLAAAVGERGVESDVFHAKMDFRGAAEASREALAGSRVETVSEAYVDGVNAYIDSGPEPLEFGLAGYDARKWTVVDTLLVGTQISWGLTGSFAPLRRAVLRERLDADDYRRLYEEPFDHGAPILREGTDGEVSGVGGSPGAAGSLRGVDPSFVDWLSTHEPPRLWGSNHWAVSGEHTDSGSPILAYDPHLTLMAPPVWYEQRVTVGDVDVRGATFPGIPFVIVGENRHGAWGFTNTGADVVDHYTYEVDGDEYRYDGEWREFDAEPRTIEVSGGEDREIQVRKTVHGAYVDREVDGETRHVGVAWTGMSGTRESQAIYEFGRTTGVDDYREAIRKMDVPTQNALYVDGENVYYHVTGKTPIRRDDGEVIRGDRVFDGSAGEAEWDGFEPFGQSDWSGFVPFEEKPGVLNPGYVGTANQRPVDDPTYPIGQEYASGFRGARIYERLDSRIEGGDPVDAEFMQSLQNDTLDIRARMLVPDLLDAIEPTDDNEQWFRALEEWDYRMDRDSEAALVFHRFYEQFREATWRDDFEALDLDEEWWPQEWPLVTLPEDDPFFGGDRAAVLAEAFEAAVEEVEEEGWSVYGDYQRTTIDHQFGGQVPALNYPRYPVGGTAYTVFNVHDDAGAGSSWRQISPMDGPSLSVIPGGQSGSYFSAHYDDQLRMWADGEYKSMAFETPDDSETVSFRGEDG